MAKPLKRACQECGATGSVLAGPTNECGWCEGCKAFGALPPAKKRRFLLLRKRVFKLAMVILTITGLPVYTNLVNSVQNHEAFALLDKADKQFAANQLQILDWFAQHGRKIADSQNRVLGQQKGRA